MQCFLYASVLRTLVIWSNIAWDIGMMCVVFLCESVRWVCVSNSDFGLSLVACVLAKLNPNLSFRRRSDRVYLKRPYIHTHALSSLIIYILYIYFIPKTIQSHLCKTSPPFCCLIPKRTFTSCSWPPKGARWRVRWQFVRIEQAIEGYFKLHLSIW